MPSTTIATMATIAMALFHGIVFANFMNPHEALKAVNLLNNFELERRQLRVELKKRLSSETGEAG